MSQIKRNNLKEGLKKLRDKIIWGGGKQEILDELRYIKQLLLAQNPQDLNTLFNAIYESNYWGGSGSGSNENLCAPYVAFLQDFFKNNNISSIVDCGCGDWQFSKNLDFSGIDYKGYDVAEFVISANKKKYTKQNVNFYLYDGNFANLPNADLVLCKDVLQHLPNAKIHSFIDNLHKYKYALITNGLGSEVNKDILPTLCRFLDLRQEPFNLAMQKVFEMAESSDYTIATMLWINPLTK